MTAAEQVTHLDAVAAEWTERDRLLRRAHLVARARADSVAGHRETIRLLTIVLALDRYTRASDAPPGWPGRPIEPTPPRLQQVIPRQRTGPPRRFR